MSVTVRQTGSLVQVDCEEHSKRTWSACAQHLASDASAPMPTRTICGARGTVYPAGAARPCGCPVGGCGRHRAVQDELAAMERFLDEMPRVIARRTPRCGMVRGPLHDTQPSIRHWFHVNSPLMHEWVVPKHARPDNHGMCFPGWRGPAGAAGARSGVWDGDDPGGQRSTVRGQVAEGLQHLRGGGPAGGAAGLAGGQSARRPGPRGCDQLLPRL